MAILIASIYRDSALRFSYEPGQHCPACNGEMWWMEDVSDANPIQKCSDCELRANTDTGVCWEKI